MRSSQTKVCRRWRVLFLSAATAMLLSACARPPSATVNEGADPINVDKDVVFRTTYYFRVFDYCVARRLKNNEFDKVIVPLTDSLYRFRMTGKAGSNISNVKFESGTLLAWEIDPFGAKVEYDAESGRTRVISPREVTADARRAAIKRDIYEMLTMYNGLKASLGENGAVPRDPPENAAVNAVMKSLSTELRGKVERFGRLDSGPTDDDAQYVDRAGKSLNDESRSALLKAELLTVLSAAFPNESQEAIQQVVDKGYGDDSTVLDASDPGRPGFVERAVVLTINKARKIMAIEQLTKTPQMFAQSQTNGEALDEITIGFMIRSKPTRLARSEQHLVALFAGTSESIQCPEDAPVRRGFQVLGPEGWRTFNQDERLMLAMSSSAEPVISTLKELSNRVISARDNPSAELLPIVLEQKRLSEAGRELDSRRAKSEIAPDVLADSVCTKLVADTEDERNICDG